MKNKKILIESLVIIILSILSVYPGFTENFFNASWDGIYHLTRFENISMSLSSGHLPSLFNFQSIPMNDQYGIAINAFYPWIGGLLFIIPRMLFTSPIFALQVGFFLLNVITIVNIRLLAGEFSKKKWPIWVGVIIYQFNNYHLIDLYSRVAIGESLGYAFFPLVLLGLVQIHKNKKTGVWILALGMGLIANSHILTLLMAIGLVVVYEIWQIVNRNFNLKKLLSILLATIVSLAIAAFSLYNVASMFVNTEVQTAKAFIEPLEPMNIFNLLLSNDMTEKGIWIYGLPLIIFQIFLTIQALTGHSKKKWHIWVYVADFSLVAIFNWWPWNQIKEGPILLIQYFSRLEIYIVLLLSVAAVLYFDEENAVSIKNSIILSISIILFSISGTYQAHYIKAQGTTHSRINDANYLRIIQQTETANDYLPINRKSDKVVDVLYLNHSDVNNSNTSYYIKDVDRKSVQIVVNSKINNNIVTLPILMYDHFQYKIILDGQRVVSITPNLLKLNLSQGTHNIYFESQQPSRRELFIFSILSTVFSFVLALYFGIKYNK